MCVLLLGSAWLARAEEADLNQFPPTVFPSPVAQCFQFSVEAGVRNNGPDPATNAQVKLTLPTTNFMVVEHSASLGTSSISNECVFFHFGTLATNATASWKVVLKAPLETGEYPLVSEAFSDAEDSDTTNNDRTIEIVVKKAPDNSFHQGTQGTRGHPVSTFSGLEVFTEAPDLALGGPLPIFFQRHYDGAMAPDGVVQSALGPNWQHNYDIRLDVDGINATVAFRQGRILRFIKDETDWNIDFQVNIPFRLVESGTDHTLTDPRSQLLYRFNNDGLLMRIEDGRGNTNSLSYDGDLLTNVTDGLGRSLSFAYDENNFLTNVTDGIRSVQFISGSPLAAVVDALGNTTTYAYDPADTNNPALLTARTLPEGNTPFSQVYNADERVAAQTDAASNTADFDYAFGIGTFETTVTDPPGFTNLHVYNDSGQETRFTDAAGNSIRMFYDSAGRRNFIQDRLGNNTFITYGSAHGKPTEIEQPGRVELQFDYTARNADGIEFHDLTQVTQPDGTIDRFEYDAAGNLIAWTNRAGDVWQFEPNDQGQISIVTNPAGGVGEFTYDARANLATSTDSDLGVTAYAYDSFNRLTNLTLPGTGTLRFAYDALDRLTSATDARTNTTILEYGANGRLTNRVDALSNATRFAYDGLDRLVGVTDRLGFTGRVGYEERGLLSAVTNRNGFVTRFEYDERRRLVAVVDPAGETTRFDYDDEALLRAASNPLGETVTIRRDPMGYVTSLTDPLGNNLDLARDEMKRVTRITDPLSHSADFAYDARGYLTNVTREAGISAAYEYDALGYLTRLTDPALNDWTFAYTPMGRLTDFADPLDRASTYAYDARGRLSEVEFADGSAFTNTYDPNGNVVRREYSDGTDLQYAYDALNRLTNAMGSDPIEFAYDALGRVINTRQVGLDFGATYDADGRLTNVTYNGGQFSVAYTYDSRDQLIAVSDTLTGSGMEFSYDDAGRVIGVTRGNGVNGAYTYDGRGLLTRIQEGGLVDIRYAYDAAGRLIEENQVAIPLDPLSVIADETVAFTHDAASQISSAGYDYDLRGRLANAPDTALTWDGASRLVGIDAVSLDYNALGDLVTRSEGGNTTRFFYNHALALSPIVAERDEGGGEFTRFHVWSPGGLLLYIINLPGNAVSYPLFNHVGSTLALTDETGAVTDSYAYDSYGRLLAQEGANSQPFRFNGAFGVRADGSLYHMRARWYDPASTHFLSREPVWPALALPQRLNVYAFADQNPLTFVDPLGDEPLTASTIIVGAVAVAAVTHAIAKGAVIVYESLPDSHGRDLEAKNRRLLEKFYRERSFNRRLRAFELEESGSAASTQPQPPGAPAPAPERAPGPGVGGTSPRPSGSTPPAGPTSNRPSGTVGSNALGNALTGTPFGALQTPAPLGMAPKWLDVADKSISWQSVDPSAGPSSGTDGLSLTDELSITGTVPLADVTSAVSSGDFTDNITGILSLDSFRVANEIAGTRDEPISDDDIVNPPIRPPRVSIRF